MKSSLVTLLGLFSGGLGKPHLAPSDFVRQVTLEEFENAFRIDVTGIIRRWVGVM